MSERQKIWPLIAQNLNFNDVWPLSPRSNDFVIVDQDQYIGSISFLILRNLKFDPSLKQIWTFFTFDNLTTGWTERSP